MTSSSSNSIAAPVSASTSVAATPALPLAAAPPQVYVQPGFHWDEQDAYLFDIDGTLLRSRDRVHYDSFFAAVKHVLDRPLLLEGVTLHGNTDPGILRDAFRIAAMEEGSWRPHVQRIFSHMSESVITRQTEMDLVVMPGVEAVLAHLQAKGAVLGVATGNIETIGWVKVAVAGLRDWFSFGGFSDQHEARSEMIAHALTLAHEALARQALGDKAAGAEATVCVVGDTIYDVTAARANGLPTIAVATGNYTFEQLMEVEPEVCATDLEALLAHSCAERR